MKQIIVIMLLMLMNVLFGSTGLFADELIFKDTPILDVLEVISEETGYSIFLDKNIDPALLKVNMFAKKMNFMKIFRTVIQSQGLKIREIGPKSYMVFPKDKIDDHMNEKYQRVFFLSNADPKEMRNIVKGFNPQMKVYIDEKINALIVFDTEENLEMVANLIDNLDKVKPQVMIDLMILEVSSSKLNTLGIEFKKELDIFPRDSNLTRTDNDANMLRLGRIDKVDLGAKLNILLSDSNTKVLASPRLKVANGNKANINIVNTVPIIKKIVSRDSGGSITEDEIEKEEVGVKFEVEVTQIDNENRVTLNVKTEVSSITGWETSPSTLNRYPTTAKKSSETTLRLRDLEQVVMGGLVEEKKSITKQKTPFLGDLPIIGKLFYRNGIEHKNSEIIMFLTPRIIYPKVKGVSMREKVVTEKIDTELEQTLKELTDMDLSIRKREFATLKEISEMPDIEIKQEEDEISSINKQFAMIQSKEKMGTEDFPTTEKADNDFDRTEKKARFINAGSLRDYLNGIKEKKKSGVSSPNSINEKIEREKRMLQESQNDDYGEKDRVIAKLRAAKQARDESQTRMLELARIKAIEEERFAAKVNSENKDKLIELAQEKARTEEYKRKFEAEKAKREAAERQAMLLANKEKEVRSQYELMEQQAKKSMTDLQNRIKDRQKVAYKEYSRDLELKELEKERLKDIDERDVMMSREKSLARKAQDRYEKLIETHADEKHSDSQIQSMKVNYHTVNQYQGWTKKITKVSEKNKAPKVKKMDKLPEWITKKIKNKGENKNKVSNIKDTSVIVEPQKESLASRIQKANILRREGKYKIALKKFEALMMEYPNNATIVYNIGSILHKLGETKKAEKTFKIALEMDPKSPYARHVRRLLKINKVY